MKTTSTSGTNHIYHEIWEPRYHDKTVVLMTSKVARDGDTYIEIKKGHYAGHYRIPAEVISDCHTEWKPSRAGNTNKFTIIPLDKLEQDTPEQDEEFLKEIEELFA